MTTYTGAFVMKDASLTLGDTDFASQITKARLVPETPVQTVRTLVPDGQITDVDSAVWTLELSGIQDFETAGLAKYLNDNAGLIVEAVLAPRKGTGKQQATFNVRCVSVPFGGEQGAFALTEVELPVQGQPTFDAQA